MVIRKTAPVALLLLVVFHASLFGQIAPGGSVSGYIRDPQGRALAGVNVVVDNPSLPGRRSTTTDGEGYYRVLNLEPADYAITADYQGFATMTRENVVVREGLNLRLDLTMTIGAVSETVIVVGRTPMLESKVAMTAVNVSGDMQRSLPLSGLRTWSDFLLLTPGVATTQARFQTYSLHGTGPASGVFLVDGADATSVIQGSTLYSQFGGETFRDIHVRTGAIDASSPLGLGPIVSIATEEGTNRWHGTAAFAYQPKRWNGDNTPGGQSLTVETHQADFSLGGPIARDRWSFFSSFRFARNQTGNPRSAQQVSFLRALDSRFTPFDNAWNGQIGFGKVTGQLSPNSRLLASYTRDVLTLGGAQPNEAGRFRNFVLGGPSYFASVSSTWSSGLTTRVSAGYNGKRQQNPNLQRSLTGVNVYQDVFQHGGSLFGAGLIGALNASPFPGADFRVHMWTVTGDATYYRTGHLGSHELRFGTYLQPNRHNQQVSIYNNHGYQLEDVVLRDPDNPAAGFIPFHKQIYEVDELTTTEVDSRDNALYVQDAWRAAPRLTLSAGLRVDFVKRVDRLFNVVTQDSREIGPRFGLNYMLTTDGESALRVSWSRVHENLSVNETQGGTNLAGLVDLYDTAGNGSFATRFVTPPSTALSSDLVIDLDHYHQGNVDELIVGYQRQFPRQAAIDVSITRREYRDRPAVAETNGIYNGNVFVGYRDPRQDAIYRLTANTWNWPVATALQFQVTKRASRAQVLAAYTREWDHLAGGWQPNDPASFIQPGAFANSNGIGFVDGCTSGAFCGDSDSLSGAPGGGTWHGHVANLGASVQGPWHLLLATSYNFQSGPWSGPILTLLDAPDPAFGAPTVTLANGRVASNPLATPLRFAYATRGQGQFKLPALHLWNVRIARRFDLGNRQVEAAVDILNVTNHGADQSVQYGGNLQFSPFFGEGANRQFPRAVQLSARFAF